MPSTYFALNTIYKTQPTSSGMTQEFTTGCAQNFRSGSMQDFKSGSSMIARSGAVITVKSGGSIVNENVTAYTSGTQALSAVSGVHLLSSTKNANFQLPQPVKGLDMLIRMETSFVTFLESTIAGVQIGGSTVDDVIKFTTQGATGRKKYGRWCRLVARSSARWDLIAPTTLQVTLSTST